MRKTHHINPDVMKLTTLSSSSHGNCYLLTSSEGNTLILECGINWMDIKKGLDFHLSCVVGCVVTHQHNDHSKSVAEVLKCGIKCLAPKDVFDAKKTSSPFQMIAEPKHSYRLGDFKITALSAFHDVPCLCYIIEHDEMGKLLFATDTYKLPYKVRGLSHLMIECNYMDAILTDNENEGYCPASLRDRLMLSHMELETTKKVVEQNLCDSLQDVILLHLSHDNSDDVQMEYEISKFGVPCHTAKSGFEIDFDNEPY